jgi:RHS repeat-associated protein
VQKSNGQIYWYGAGSEILDESDSSGNITDEYIFFGGKRIAHRVVSGNAIYYYAEDFLGSSRVMTTSTGTACYDADFYPYGGERVVTNTCPQNYKFTGKERDAETNNDDFGARYYSSQFGRWISPDWSAIPAPVPYANLTNPQTLNLYAMVHDNPETFADLDGHCPECVEEIAEEIPGVLEEISPELKQVGEQISAEIAPFDNAITNASNKVGDWIVGGLAAGLAALKGDNSPTPKPDNAQPEDKKSPEPQPQADGAGAKKGGGDERKPDTRATKPEKNTLEGAQDQRESITKAKNKLNKTGQGEKIRSIKKSQQREANALKKIKSAKDVHQ